MLAKLGWGVVCGGTVAAASFTAVSAIAVPGSSLLAQYAGAKGQHPDAFELTIHLRRWSGPGPDTGPPGPPARGALHGNRVRVLRGWRTPSPRPSPCLPWSNVYCPQPWAGPVPLQLASGLAPLWESCGRCVRGNFKSSCWLPEWRTCH